MSIRAKLYTAIVVVVAGLALPGVDRRQVDLVDHGLVGLDDAVVDGDAEAALRPQDGDPELTLEHHLAFR